MKHHILSTIMLVGLGAASLLHLAPQQTEQVVQQQSNYSPRLQAFLDTIAWAETGTPEEEGYRKIVFGGKFNSFKTHPLIKNCGLIRGKRICSTAAGRYQMMDFNWPKLKRRLRLKDFSPRSQDKMALALINEKGALPDIEAGRFEIAAKKIGGVWASFPHNSYRQNPKSMARLKSYYVQRLAVRSKR